MINSANISRLTATQQAMLLFSMYAPKSAAYVEQFCYEFRGTLDVQAFKQAWQGVLDRHSILRTSFSWSDDGEPSQVVHPNVEIPFSIENWQDVPDSVCGGGTAVPPMIHAQDARATFEQKARLAAFLESDIARGFDVAQVPLLRVAVIQTAVDSFYIVLSNHHLVLDGWSMGIVRREVSSLYQAITRGEEVDLPAAPAFSDFVAWLDRQSSDESEAFWKKELKGFQTANALPIDSAPGAVPTPDETFGEQTVDLSPEMTARLQTIARKHRLTLSTIAQGAWALLLNRYCHSDDVMFGITVSGRPFDYPDIDSLVGLLIGTLPLRVRISPDATVSAWLQETQKAAFKLRDYETSSLEIHACSEVQRGAGLFESIVVFENFAGHDVPFDLSGEVALVASHLARTNFPLTLVVNQGQQIGLRAVYHHSRFADEAIARMLRQLVTILENFAENLDQRVADVNVLPVEEAALLREWSGVTPNATDHELVHHSFEKCAMRTPDAIAIVHRSGDLTYAELNSRANELAHLLREQWEISVEPKTGGTGVPPVAHAQDARATGIFLDRSPEMIVALLAVLKAGGAYVPLDPTYPADRLEFMLADSRAQVVLTRGDLRDRLPEFEGRVISLDAEQAPIDRQPANNVAAETHRSDLAYVMYTSGSTGKPKGVMIEHAALASFTASARQQYGLTSADRVLQFASLSFDTSVEEIFGALTCGAALVLRSDDMITSAKQFLEECAQHELTVLDLPTGYWHQLVAEIADQRLSIPSQLRLVILGGEEARADSVAKWLEHAPHVRLINTYGPTEATVVTTTFDLSHHDCAGGIPIGRPISGAEVYVLDERLRPTPIGVPGELFIGGAGLARGYFNRPELTSEKFIDSPFGAGRLYRSGDLVRYLSDGNLEFLGRADNQVKIRGFRIELEEVEAALRTHELISDAVVVVREDADGDKRLHAYLVLEPEQRMTTSELRAFAKTLLPPHMVPATFTTLAAFPLMPNGKTDRRALPDPEVDQQPVEDFVRPHTPTEEIITEIWCRTLKLPQVSIHDNFFELGGHSLLAARVFSELQRTFDIQMSLVEIFKASTVAQLAEIVCERQAAENPDDELMSLLSELDELTEEEAHRRLSDEIDTVALAR